MGSIPRLVTPTRFTYFIHCNEMKHFISLFDYLDDTGFVPILYQNKLWTLVVEQHLFWYLLDELLFFFDGSVKCFSKEHLALFIPSVLILVFLVIPFPFVILLISFGYIRVAPHVSDIITKGYRWLKKFCLMNFLKCHYIERYFPIRRAIKPMWKVVKK